jgi:hypothetical protein
MGLGRRFREGANFSELALFVPAMLGYEGHFRQSSDREDIVRKLPLLAPSAQSQLLGPAGSDDLFSPFFVL